MTNDEIRTVREAAVSYRPMWKKHQIDLMRKTGTATIHAEMSLNTIEAMAAMLEECRLQALSSGNVYLLDKLELFLDDYKANPDQPTTNATKEPMTTHKDSRISALEAVVRELVERGPRHLIDHTNNYSDDVYWQHAKAKALSLLGEMQD